MGDMPQHELESAPLGPHRPRADERDRARTPMQWAAGSGAGFTAVVPWLPVEPGADSRNVESEKADPNSLYHWYASLLKLRRENAALRDGIYVPLISTNPAVFAFARATADGRGALVVLNMSEREEHAVIGGWPGAVQRLGKTLLASPKAAAPPSPDLHIAPFGVLIVSYTP